MKWDETGIAVCESCCIFSTNQRLTLDPHPPKGSFYRTTVPQNILDGQPNPSTWGMPVAALDPAGCNPLTYFTNHSIVFGQSLSTSLLRIVLILFWPDITFCGIYNRLKNMPMS
jgi:hypothetical protein